GMDGYEECMTPTYFDHYFRHLYRILKFVAESPLINKEEDRYEYACMVRATLSRYELIWLYYNALSCYGRDKFKPLIERFTILKNLREEMLVRDLKLDISYDATALLNEPTKNIT
ncbi:MAG: putative phage abortive infection protein, partial [Muribaculum sp.]|nr:putative phage abortive infection protein [Muribaculum sp.]